MTSRAFQILPIEVNENIAFYLDSDKDFANFNAICRQTRATIQSHRCGAWRARWKQNYDMAPGRNGQMLKVEYMRRRMILCSKTFSKGFGVAEKNCIAVLKQLIIESFSDSSGGCSKNVLQLERFVAGSNILRALTTCVAPQSEVNQELQVLLICLANWGILNSSRIIGGVAKYLPYSQVLVYLKFEEFPLFERKGTLSCSFVNTKLVLAMMYFWRYHIRASFTEGMHAQLHPVQDRVKVHAWKSPVLEASNKVRPLSGKWKGLHGYCPNRELLEDAYDEGLVSDIFQPEFDDILIDEFDQEGVQNIEFDFTPTRNHTEWTLVAEQYLQALPSESLCRHIREVTRTENSQESKLPAVGHLGTSRRPNQKLGSLDHWLLTGKLNHPKSTQGGSQNFTHYQSPEKERDFLPFDGSMNREDSSAIHGVLHDLPNQCGFPGFQRITFLTYDKRDMPNPEDFDSLETTVISRNEGVVLPGGHLIIGRWWNASFEDDPCQSGPLIMWKDEK